MQSTINKTILLLIICLFVAKTFGQDVGSGTDIFRNNTTYVTTTNQSSLITSSDGNSTNSSSTVLFQNETTTATNKTTGYPPPHSPPVQQRNIQYGLAMLYVFLFIIIVFVPFFYYNLCRCRICKRCVDTSSDQNNTNTNDEEQGRQPFGNSSSSRSIRFNIQAVSQNHQPPSHIRSLFTSSATYGYTGASNNVPESYVDRTENGILKRKYIEEKIAQLQQLLVPYKLTLTEDNFPTRSIFHHSQSAMSEILSVENRRTSSKSVNNGDEQSSLETDDATTCTNESTTGNCEDDDYCSKNNKPTNNKDNDQTKVTTKEDCSPKQLPSSTSAESSDDFYNRFDLSDNPYGDEDSIMIKVPRPAVTVTDYENAVKSKSDEDLIHKSNTSLTKKIIQSDQSESSSSSSTSTLVESPILVDDVESQPSFSPRVPSPGSHVARLEMSLARLLTIASGEEPQYGSSDDNDESSKVSRVVPGVCSICLSTYRVGNEVVWSSNPLCEHVFHYECMEPWLMKQKDGPFCPCCRREFVLDPVEEVIKENGMGTTIDLDNSIVEDEGDGIQDMVQIALTAPSTEDGEGEESHHTRGVHI